jgi:hypothetical protein
MMAIDDTGTDLWTVVGAWEELEGGGVKVKSLQNFRDLVKV